MEISYSTHHRSHMRYLLRTSLILLLILVPVIISGCIYHHSDSREPFVYMIDPSGDEEAGVSLIIMAAVSSFSSMAPDQDVISGKINTSCHLGPDSNMIGDILLMNISSPRCRLLVEDSSFLQLLQKSNVAATIILDDTPR